jgi:hypothetical protein
VYAVGLYNAQLAFRATKWWSEQREKGSARARACPRGKTCECSAWTRGHGAGMQKPFTPPRAFVDAGSWYALGREEMNKLRPSCARVMGDIRDAGLMQDHIQ